jgi:hypothetical protein
MEIFEDIRPNSKPLGLGLPHGNKKVTVGFKCDPKVKLKLANEAQERGLTLSEYVENLLLTLEENKGLSQKRIDELTDRLAFYENGILLSIYEKHKGQEISFNNADGNSMQVRIKEPKDVYTILIHSFIATND